MKVDNMIAFIIEEAQHRVINDDQTKTAESALAACTKKTSKPKRRKKDKSKSDVTCKNCDRPGHYKDDCWSKGSGKEGQGPRQKKKGKTTNTVVVAADNKDNELFAFTCTSGYAAVVDTLDIPKSRLGICMDSGVSRHYCPDHSKFTNYKPIEWKITTANGSTLTTAGMGDLHIELPNGSGKSKTIFKNVIHTPDMAFNLISISKRDKAGFSIMFNKGMCTIRNHAGKAIATIPSSDGLYKIAARWSNQTQTANVVSGKMSISKAHRKLKHVSCHAIKHAISNGLIAGIELDPNSKPKFCEACTKAKSACQLFPKESETRAKNFGERVHWDLWGPASVKSLNSHSYIAHILMMQLRNQSYTFNRRKVRCLNPTSRMRCILKPKQAGK